MVKRKKRGKWVQWTQSDREKLAVLWPEAPRKEIMAALPGRSWRAFIHQAHISGFRRGRPPAATSKRLNKLAVDLTKARLAANLSQFDLAKKIGIADPTQISRSERLGDHLSIFMLRAWCDALGLELRALPKPKKKELPDISTATDAKDRMALQAEHDMRRWREAAE